MKLSIGDFFVRDIVFGPETSYRDGILTVNEAEAIQALNPEGKLMNVKLHIARPGESVRILPIKEVIEARTRPDKRAVFPGLTGGVTACGEGEVFALKNMDILAVGKYGGWMEGILDMDGPGARLSNLGNRLHLCFTAENTDPTVDQGQHMNLNFRMGAMLLAEYIGRTVRGQIPDEYEVYEMVEGEESELPKVVLVMQLNSFYETLGFDDTFYGTDAMFMTPPLVHPNEVLDGAVCSGSICIAGQRAYTYDYQNYPMIKRLYREHGRTLNFAGVIFAIVGPTLDKKERGAIRVAETAKLLGCDAALVVQPADGNGDIDLFKMIKNLEAKGIKTVAVGDENSGMDGRSYPTKAMLDPCCDAYVSCGMTCQVYELPPMERIIGDLESVMRDPYPGTWAENATYGPSLREDGSLVVDTHVIIGNNGAFGWSRKTCKDF